MGPVAAEHNKAVKSHFGIGILHFFQLGCFAALSGRFHQLERLAGGAEDGAAQRQNTGKIFRVHPVEIPFDESTVAVPDPVDLNVAAKFLIEGLCYAADRGIQALAVAAACQNADFLHD